MKRKYIELSTENIEVYTNECKSYKRKILVSI